MRQWAIVLPPTPRPVIPCLPLPAPTNGTGTHLGPAACDAVIVGGGRRARGGGDYTDPASAGNAVPVPPTERTSDSYIEEDDLSEN